MSIAWPATLPGAGSGLDAGRTPAGGSDATEVCIPNISLSERRKRLVAGVIQFVAGLAILAALMAAGADRGWRLLLLLFFWGAAVGFFQWRDKT